MRYFKSAFARLFFVFLLTILTAYPAFAATGQFVPGEALVVIENPVAARGVMSAASIRTTAATVAQSVHAQAVTTFDALSETSGKVFTFVRSATQSTEELIESLNANPNVLAASPNWITRATAVPNDPDYDDLWGIQRIGAETAWDITSGDASVYVAVLDSGIAGTSSTPHEDLVGNVDWVKARNFMVSPPTNTVTDGHGHGTHVSGTIGAVGNNGKGVVGVNWNVKILPIKVLGDDGSGSTLYLMEGINYLVGLLNDDPTMKIAAINASLGWYDNQTPNSTRDAIWQAFKALDVLNRTVIVVAAGNEAIEVGAPLTAPVFDGGVILVGAVGEYAYPASYSGLDNLIVVGAIDNTDNAASFTNWSSSGVHLAAPGVGILSTIPNNGYGSANGTSMAAPHVAGAVALLAAHQPTWLASQLRARLLETADDTVNPQQATTTPAPQRVPDRKISTYGLLRVDLALDDGETGDPVPVTSIILKTALLGDPFVVGKTGQITATVTPGNATNKTLTWHNSDDAILDFDEVTGRFTALSVGTSTITATTTDGSGLSNSATITVTDPSAPVPVTGITLSGPATVTTGTQGIVTANVQPTNATNRTVTWASSNTGVLTVDATGTVSAISAGAANVTATATDGSSVTSAPHAITVTDAAVDKPVTFIALDGPSALLVGRQGAVTVVNILPPNATNPGVTWSSSDDAILTVDNNGTVTAIAEGTATVTATAMDGSSTTGSVEIEVTGTGPVGRGVNMGCAAFGGGIPLAVAACFLVVRRRTRTK